MTQSLQAVEEVVANLGYIAWIIEDTMEDTIYAIGGFIPIFLLNFFV